MNNVIQHRDSSIDILRSLAIIGIFIAHSNPDLFFVQLRGFDVVLMVFLSAVCAKGFDKPDFNYFEFVKKRGIRLILPVWIFLCVYFIGVYMFYYLPPISDIVMMFSFMSERYVWIIRILIVLALAAPLLYNLTKSLSYKYLILILIAGLLLTDVIFSNFQNKVLETVLMTIPYALVYIVGLNLKSITSKQLKWLGISLVMTFLAIALYLSINSDKVFVPTSDYKYPPRLYYIAYGLGFTLLLWVSRLKIQKVFEALYLHKFTKYVGQHTYWLYLWHIPVVDIVGDSFNPLVRFIFIFGIALSCVFVQDTVVKKFVNNRTLVSIFNG